MYEVLFKMLRNQLWSGVLLLLAAVADRDLQIRGGPVIQTLR